MKRFNMIDEDFICEYCGKEVKNYYSLIDIFFNYLYYIHYEGVVSVLRGKSTY